MYARAGNVFPVFQDLDLRPVVHPPFFLFSSWVSSPGREYVSRLCSDVNIEWRLYYRLEWCQTRGIYQVCTHVYRVYTSKCMMYKIKYETNIYEPGAAARDCRRLMRRCLSSYPGQYGRYAAKPEKREAHGESVNTLRQNGGVRGVDTREGLSPRSPPLPYIQEETSPTLRESFSLAACCLLAAVCLLHARGGLAECWLLRLRMNAVHQHRPPELQWCHLRPYNDVDNSSISPLSFLIFKIYWYIYAGGSCVCWLI